MGPLLFQHHPGATVSANSRSFPPPRQGMPPTFSRRRYADGDIPARRAPVWFGPLALGLLDAAKGQIVRQDRACRYLREHLA